MTGQWSLGRVVALTEQNNSNGLSNKRDQFISVQGDGE